MTCFIFIFAGYIYFRWIDNIARQAVYTSRMGKCSANIKNKTNIRNSKIAIRERMHTNYLLLTLMGEQAAGQSVM